MIFAILHTNIINLLGIHSYMNDLCNSIQTTGINNTTFTNALNFFWSTNQVPSRYLFTLALPIHDLFVEVGNRLTRETMPSLLFLEHIMIICLLTTAKLV